MEWRSTLVGSQSFITVAVRGVTACALQTQLWHKPFPLLLSPSAYHVVGAPPGQTLLRAVSSCRLACGNQPHAGHAHDRREIMPTYYVGAPIGTKRGMPHPALRHRHGPCSSSRGLHITIGPAGVSELCSTKLAPPKPAHTVHSHFSCAPHHHQNVATAQSAQYQPGRLPPTRFHHDNLCGMHCHHIRSCATHVRHRTVP